MKSKKTARTAKLTILPPAPVVELTAKEKRRQYMKLYMRTYRATVKAKKLAKLESKREASRAWYAANRDRHIANVLAWQARNPEKTRQIKADYFARVRKTKSKLGSKKTPRSVGTKR